MKVSIGLGNIEAVSENGLNIRVYKPVTHYGADSILFCNHDSGEQYSFRDSELKQAREECNQYRVDVVMNSINYNDSVIDYCKNHSVFESLEVIDGSINVGDTEVLNLIHVIMAQDAPIINSYAEVRVQNIKSSLNLTDVQYETLEQHFSAMP